MNVMMRIHHGEVQWRLRPRPVPQKKGENKNSWSSREVNKMWRKQLEIPCDETRAIMRKTGAYTARHQIVKGVQGSKVADQPIPEFVTRYTSQIIPMRSLPGIDKNKGNIKWPPDSNAVKRDGGLRIWYNPTTHRPKRSSTSIYFFAHAKGVHDYTSCRNSIHHFPPCTQACISIAPPISGGICGETPGPADYM